MMSIAGEKACMMPAGAATCRRGFPTFLLDIYVIVYSVYTPAHRFIRIFVSTHNGLVRIP